MPTQQIDTIDQVIARMTDLVDQARADASRLGYFSALYRKVTLEVKKGIAEGFFDDGPRMERLVVIFAGRYLDAYDAYRAGEAPSQCWLFAFEAAGQWWPIVLQHLLLGMNAHINLDLGIAAARVVQPGALPTLRGDFNKINTVLARLVGGVQDELAQIWVTLRWMNRYLGSVEDAVINFSMEKARDCAWAVAERLAPLDAAAQAREIKRLDHKTLKLARLIRKPGLTGSTVNAVIRLGERGTTAQIIDILM